MTSKSRSVSIWSKVIVIRLIFLKNHARVSCWLSFTMRNYIIITHIQTPLWMKIYMKYMSSQPQWLYNTGVIFLWQYNQYWIFIIAINIKFLQFLFSSSYSPVCSFIVLLSRVHSFVYFSHQVTIILCSNADCLFIVLLSGELICLFVSSSNNYCLFKHRLFVSWLKRVSLSERRLAWM